MFEFPARKDSSLFNGPPQIAMSVLGALQWSLHIQCQPWNFQWIAWKTAPGRSQEFHFPARNDNPANSPRNGIILGKNQLICGMKTICTTSPQMSWIFGLRISPPGMIIPWPMDPYTASSCLGAVHILSLLKINSWSPNAPIRSPHMNCRLVSG